MGTLGREIYGTLGREIYSIPEIERGENPLFTDLLDNMEGMRNSLTVEQVNLKGKVEARVIAAGYCGAMYALLKRMTPDQVVALDAKALQDGRLGGIAGNTFQSKLDRLKNSLEWISK